MIIAFNKIYFYIRFACEQKHKLDHISTAIPCYQIVYSSLPKSSYVKDILY